jgi:hypothetical protein
MTIAQLCDEYSARDNGKKPITIKSDKSRIKLHIKPKLGKFRVASITSDHVEDFMHSLSSGSQGRTVGLLGAIFVCREAQDRSGESMRWCREASGSEAQ